MTNTTAESLMGMTHVGSTLPKEPEVVTEEDLAALRELKERHTRELATFEADTRNRRKELKKLKQEQKVKAAVPGAEAPVEAVRARQAAPVAEVVDSAQVSLPTGAGQADLHAARVEVWFNSERDRLASELPEAASDVGEFEFSEGEPQWCRNPSRSMSVASFRTAEEPISGGCSAVCSAAASRSASPCGSEAAAAASAQGMAEGLFAVHPAAVVPAVAAVASASAPPSNGAQAKVANVAGVPPPPKAPGKGKGKGKNNPPPPPRSTPRQSIPQGGATPGKSSRYVNIHWKASDKQEVPEPKSPFLARLKDPGPRDEPMDRSKLEGLPPKVMVLPDSLNTVFFPSVLPERKAPEAAATTGDALDPYQLLNEPVLDAYFKKSEAKVTMHQVENSRQNVSETQPCKLLDQKRLNMLGIMLQKHLMEHKETDNKEAILNIKRSLLQCNFKVLRLEALSVIRTVLRQHDKDKKPLCSYVMKYGEDAISKLEYPDHHYLVYELQKVPQVDERLECMLFNVAFKESITTCRQNLETLRKALLALKAKRELIRRFFITTHRLGLSLTQKASRGFQLSTLEKLTHTKSTKMQHLNLLHFCLALLSREDAQALFTQEDITLLRNAKALGTHKVCEECRELASGLYGVKQIYESETYTSRSTGQAVKIERRRKTLPPSAAALPLQERAIDEDDRFHEVMKNFVQKHEEEADDIINVCHKIILEYKELAIYFDDLNSVYPPKKCETDKKQDLLDIFARFAEDLPRHREQVEAENLRELISDQG